MLLRLKGLFKWGNEIFIYLILFIFYFIVIGVAFLMKRFLGFFSFKTGKVESYWQKEKPLVGKSGYLSSY